MTWEWAGFIALCIGIPAAACCAPWLLGRLLDRFDPPIGGTCAFPECPNGGSTPHPMRGTCDKALLLRAARREWKP